MAARKEAGKGRPKGGIILATKKGIYEEDTKIRRWKEFLGKEVRRKGKRMYVGVTYMRECRKENREMMEKMMELARSEVIIFGGDYNARTGEEMGCELYKEKRRRSKDKVLNVEGEELLENKGLNIVNGRTEGDKEGNFTYISSRGCTVIDYVVTNEEEWEKIKSCKIEERVESDHFPVTIGWSTEEEEADEEKWTVKYMWDEESIKRY